MKSISGKKLCKIVEKKGWILKKITGSHHIYEKSDESKIISIPVHRNQDLKLGTLKSISNSHFEKNKVLAPILEFKI